MIKPEWIIYNSSFAKYLGLDGIVLYPFVLISKKKCDTLPSLLKHELTHVNQVKRYGFCKFYVTYLYFIVKTLLKKGDINAAFTENEFEYEAYGIENEPLTDAEIIQIGYNIPRTDLIYKNINKNKSKKTI